MHNSSKSIMTVAVALLVCSTGSALIDLTQEPMSADRLLGILKAHPEATTLDQVPKLLPEDFLMNFVLKHGLKREGERGHLIETKVSQSADPMAPRAIIFDERTGFTVSYNGGGETQLANQRLDTMSFDLSTKKFRLEQIDFPIVAGHAALKTSDCATCHGPSMRPIFAMYPDWPSFYGSDNDELTGTNEVQRLEAADYREFLKDVAVKHPRYSPLFSAARVAKYLDGKKLYPTFPYRPDSSEAVASTSRAFAFRPELRVGIVYNRLQSQSVVAKLTSHPRYKEYGTYFLFNLLQCSWSAGSEKSQATWLAKVQGVIGQKPKTLSGGLLDYRQNWSLFDLKINDVDIRYSYNHEGYANQDASQKVMEVGYIGRYFNSYFDGSATIDELVAGALYLELSGKQASLKGITEPWGLVAKYERLADRYKLDKNYFQQMDKLGKWIEMPYPQQLSAVHHRETFTSAFATDYNKLCSALERAL